MSSPAWVVLTADPRWAEGIAQLFVRADVPCFCQYYQFAGDHRQWLDRCANAPEDSQRALLGDLEQHRLHAVIAVEQEADETGAPERPAALTRVVGWARVAPRSQMGKLYDNRLYKALSVLHQGDRESTFAVSCFLVDPAWRRQGVARALLTAAVELARKSGARSVEAFPRGAEDVSDAEQWTGPRALYEEMGFERVVDFGPYPVFRLKLEPLA